MAVKPRITMTVAELAYLLDNGSPGVFLPGLDNGYVVDVESDVDLRNGDYNTSFAEGRVLITFHDANGDENYLLVPPDATLEVEEDA